MSARLTPSTIVMLLLPPLLWAGNAVVGRMVQGMVPPVLMNFIRWIVRFAVLLPLAGRVRNPSNAGGACPGRWRPPPTTRLGLAASVVDWRQRSNGQPLPPQETAPVFFVVVKVISAHAWLVCELQLAARLSRWRTLASVSPRRAATCAVDSPSR